MNRSLLVFFLVGTLLTGCGLRDRNLKETLSEKDVVGTWKLTQDSLRLLTRDKFQSDPSHLYTITFRTDGTCTFASVSVDFQGGNYTVVDGTWRLEHDTTGDSNVRKRNAIRMELHPKPNYTAQRYFNFARDDQKQLKLWNYYGDPDQWEFIEYSRNASSEAGTRKL
jgi:hypothetical protein